MTPRPVEPTDIAPLVRLWHDVWHETHAPLVPAALVRLRTHADFSSRFPAMIPRTRAIGPVGDPLGFCTIDGAELDQLYLSPRGRGTHVAAALMADGEARLAAVGVTEAFLLCVPENIRARAFYTRSGWQEGAVAPHPLKTATGTFDLPTLVFTKTLG